MRICFNQPAFIPWGGFFARLIFSDRMVLLDDTLFSNGFTFVNRNRLKGPSGEVWITVPIKRKNRGRQTIRKLDIFEKQRWARKFLSTLVHCYGKSLYFETIFPQIKEIVEADDNNFLKMVIPLLGVFQKELGIQKDFILQSELGITETGTGLLLALAKELNADEVILPYFSQNNVNWQWFEQEGISVGFLRYSPPPTPQFWGGYNRNLSAMDLLFCMGSDSRKIIDRGSALISI